MSVPTNHPQTVGGVPWFSPRLREILGSKYETYGRGPWCIDGPTDHRWGPSLGFEF